MAHGSSLRVNKAPQYISQCDEFRKMVRDKRNEAEANIKQLTSDANELRAQLEVIESKIMDWQQVQQTAALLDGDIAP